MKKYGKYEKRPEGVPEKQPKVKSALLQTYLTSLLCMALCVTMFFGTSFAWFTSEVNNEGNEIYIGTLRVGLFKKSGDRWLDLDGSGTKLFDGDIRWEPGYTAMETIQIKNEGDLAFLYEMTFINKETDPAILQKVGKNFVVYVHPGDYAEGEAVPASFAEIEQNAAQEDASKRTWRPVRIGTQIATLADIIEKEIPVLSDSMSDVRADAVNPAAPTPGPNDSKPTKDTYIIALHMIEDAKNPEIMGHKVQLNVKLKAYQRAYEKDAFDAAYDLGKLEANVIELGKMEDVACSAWLGQETVKMDLDAAYQYLPVESAEEVQVSPYKDYIADFAIWADKDVPANTIALAGYYDLFCSLNNDRWIALTADFDVPANKTIRLVKDLYPVTYQLLCQYGNDGIGFLCGIADLSKNGEISGTNITVELRLYEVDKNGKETGKYTVIGQPQKYTCE